MYTLCGKPTETSEPSAKMSTKMTKWRRHVSHCERVAACEVVIELTTIEGLFTLNVYNVVDTIIKWVIGNQQQQSAVNRKI